MSDLVIIPLGQLGTLEMPRDVFEQHIVRPKVQPIAKSVGDELLDAEQLEERTNIPASWWMTQARERRVPFRKFGRYVRFALTEVLACDAYQRRAIDSTGHHIHNGAASD